MKRLLSLFLPSVPTLVKGVSKAAAALDLAAAREAQRTQDALTSAAALIKQADEHRAAAKVARNAAAVCRSFIA